MHKYKVGQTVHFASNARTGVAGVYKIVRLVPSEDSQCRYRIKGPHENFERIAEEYQLTKAA